MVSFIQKRLQVFISSTYTDLIAERQAAVEAVLTAGHIPAGMELFTSGDETQTDVIKQWIDESDVFMLILGGRYGSIEPKSRKSYVQVEYEHAIEQNKPYFACVITEDALESRVRSAGSAVKETVHAHELKQFRCQVLDRNSKFWGDAKDIKIAVAQSLAHVARSDTLIGWIRGDQQANLPALAEEIARLSKENAALRSRLAALSASDIINGISFEQLKAICEDRDCLRILENFRSAFMHYGSVEEDMIADPDDLPTVNELCLLGLLARQGRGLELTAPGQRFLNRLLLERRDNDGT